MVFIMKSDIDPHQAIRVFQIIRQHGEKVDDGYTLGGLTGSTDFDGYTVFLNDQAVSLAVYFHYKFKLEYKHAHELEAFNTKLNAIDNMTFD